MKVESSEAAIKRGVKVIKVKTKAKPFTPNMGTQSELRIIMSGIKVK